MRLTLDVYFHKIQKFLREGRGKTGYKRVTKRGRRDFRFWVGKVLRALGETESGGQSVGNCEGENTRPRVFRAAPTLPGGWKQGSVLRWDLTSSHPAVSGRFPAGAPETARDGACAPLECCSRSFFPPLSDTRRCAWRFTKISRSLSSIE